MSFTFEDRVSTYPNRYKVTREDGTAEYLILERADEPSVVGTPLNAATFNAMQMGTASVAYNLLDNSDFSNPVNQRGATSYETHYPEENEKYAIDRWAIDTSCCRVTINTGYLNVKSTNGSQVRFHQRIAPGVIKEKCEYTIACTLKNGSVFCATASAGEGNAVCEMRVYNTELGYTEATYLRFRYDSYHETYVAEIAPMGGGVDIVNLALYEGRYTTDKLPKYQSKGYGVELTECRRYYRQSEFFNCVQTNGQYFSVSKVIEMRIIPTVTFDYFSPYGSDNVLKFNGCSLSIQNISPGVQGVAYADLPTCSGYKAGGLVANLSADL